MCNYLLAYSTSNKLITLLKRSSHDNFDILVRNYSTIRTDARTHEKGRAQPRGVRVNIISFLKILVMQMPSCTF